MTGDRRSSAATSGRSPARLYRQTFSARCGQTACRPNIQAIIITQGQAALGDVVQLADKIAEVTPSPCVAPVSSSSADICTLTARID